MRILLTTLHSKYIHSSLALQYLKSYCRDMTEIIDIKEYTINHDLDYVLAEIYRGQHEIVCFSCYIWNIEQTLRIAKNLKKVNPKVKIILGGPEVSFDARELLDKSPFIDYIVIGEGEATFKELLDYLVKFQGDLESIQSIAFRVNGVAIETNERGLIKELDTIPSPFGDGLVGYDNRIIYYESSRGCPHNCRYCLSSTIKGVRFLSIDRVKKDMDVFLAAGVKQVKFVDRTFNAKKSHCLEIMRYLHEHDNGTTNFHFEITADLLDEEILAFLSLVREGLFQFEVGVQTTYDMTMEAIDRKVDFHRLSQTVKHISKYNNIHLHLDLIAGLPHETLQRFKLSFDEVYNLRPEKLQLGFLKLLKGSGIRRDEGLHGYIYRDEPPYEVLGNRYLTYREMLQIKVMEEMVEHYFNTHAFDHGVEFILKQFYKSAAEFYLELGQFWEARGYHHTSHGRNAMYEILLVFYQEKKWEAMDYFRELLKLDYLKQGKSTIPLFFESLEDTDFKNKVHQFLQNQDNVVKYLPRFEGQPAKQIIKKVHFESFQYDVLQSFEKLEKVDIHKAPTTLLFDYALDYKVFSKSKVYKIDLEG
ncbi:MAG: hypothetical protein K0R93_3333 [Anaerosolibacter sp.]|uniref:B12-binding domain-containing radical SAM protein n=1 Tax=Anaerosolibacter sp. TaxID=1872527 RepID=UPI0026303160|nr:B12-binding domain-containing radical SAM protein [Anaerosolibacter sp.]MDF2548435.1 hypothetical protein [Anaerosolibacter sp.]